MRTIRKSVALTLATTIGLAALVPASAMAQGGCDWYVKVSLEQQAKNVASACPKKGPQWSSDRMVHKKFCASVRPIVWKKVAQMRKAALETKCDAK